MQRRSVIRCSTVTLKYLTSTTNSAGTTYYYLRKRGQSKVPLGKGPIDTPEFLSRYSAAMGTRKTPSRAAKDSLGHIIELFKASANYRAYSEAYRGTLGRHSDALKECYGSAPFFEIKPHHIRSDLSQLSPHAANDRLKIWRLLCQYAYDHNFADHVASDGIKRGKLPKTDGHRPWTTADVNAFRAKWEIGSVQRLCFELLFWTAARTIDAVTLTPSMIGSDGVLTFTQAKTGGKAYVPWNCALPSWAKHFEADRTLLKACITSTTFTFLETSNGRTRSRKGLSNIISAGAAEAKLTGLSAHGLRKSRLTAIAEAGGSASAIMSWGGHKSLKEAEDYVSTANRKSVLIGTEQKQKSANTTSKSANKLRN
ncbi:MAG: hypothetical protein CMN15_00875 [Roseovarius sp.]|nr:hypothetical protein [Roseovarius sp.]